MLEAPANYLLVVSDREALGWILGSQRAAFPPSRRKTPSALNINDRLLVYTTRGCFRNPTRDRGRLVARALVRSHEAVLHSPVQFGERSFARGCDLEITSLAPLDAGPVLANLVPRLRTFPASWATHIRRTLVPLDDHDFGELTSALEAVAVPRKTALQPYLDRARLSIARPK
ncbi:hypothetical protein GCM10009863_19730 [Streptomyces axinellae]|uniref:EVE domain-containing protein n=1 Tax=Streptomyces axinellae TaxID=552788 RepID=A0ABN3PYB2_9ACTN